MLNLKTHSPVWLVNMTAILAVLTPILPSLIQSLPGSVSDVTRDWLTWFMSALTAVSGVITAFAKSNIASDVVGGGSRPNDPPKPKDP